MNRPILTCALLVLVSAALYAQQPNSATQPGPYSGTAAPPPDDTIESSEPQQPQPLPKPHAGKPLNTQPATAAQPAAAGQPGTPGQPDPTGALQPDSANQPANYDPNAGTDAGIVQPVQRPLTKRYASSDPDGDVVHPEPLPPGVLGEGAVIRVRLLDQLSTRDSEKGDTFRSKVATDVLEGGQVLIPAGSEIDGTVVTASSGTHLGSRGSMHLRPETVILPNGSRYQLEAYIAGAPGSRARIDKEGNIGADARIKRGSIEYGAAMGVGAIAGAVMGGPAGAVAGTLIGAGVVTTHLLVSHPQAKLEPGSVLLFTLTKPLNLVATPTTTTTTTTATAGNQ